MKAAFIFPTLALVASVIALEVESPSEDDSWDFSSKQTIKWDSVSSDPSTVDIVLVNMNVYPTVSKTIASGVSTSDGSYTVSGLSDVTSGDNYQVNLVNVDNDGILAQSEKFTVSGSSSSSSSASASSTGTSSASSTASSASSASASSGSATSSASSKSTATSSGASTMSTATKTGSSKTANASSDASSTGSASASSSASSTASPSDSGASAIQVSSALTAMVMGAIALFA